VLGGRSCCHLLAQIKLVINGHHVPINNVL
jgi:hypothetical protein